MSNHIIIGAGAGKLQQCIQTVRILNLPKLRMGTTLELVKIDQSSVQVFSKLKVLHIDSCSTLTRMPADNYFPSSEVLTIRNVP